MRRVWPFQVLLFLGVVGAAGLVGLTHYPESPILERATSWPVVGPLARKIRRTYLPPGSEPAVPAPAKGKVEAENQKRPSEATAESTPGPPFEVRAFEARPFEWFQAGTAIYRAPSLDAEVILRLDNPARFSFFEERGEWARIRLASREAWILVNEDTLSQEPPLGREASPVTPVSGRVPDPDRLAQARHLLGAKVSQRSLGPYELLTDVEDESLLDFLGAVARAHGSAHFQRYGLKAVGEPTSTVVLFSRDEDYRRYQLSETGLEEIRAAGHAGSGIVALPVGNAAQDIIAGVLVHELTHMLNRRTIGPALPPWLEEGLAVDLGGSQLSEDGEILPGTVQESSRRDGARLEVSGFSASLQLLRRANLKGEWVPIQELLALEWEEFVGSGRLPLHYAQSALWIRFLLAPETGYGPRFRAFLEGVSRGQPATVDSLESYLEQPWFTLDGRFRTWLRVHLESHRPRGFAEEGTREEAEAMKKGGGPPG